MDLQPSPIDGYIIYLAIVGLFVIYYTYKKSNRLVEKLIKKLTRNCEFFIFYTMKNIIVLSLLFVAVFKAQFSVNVKSTK